VAQVGEISAVTIAGGSCRFGGSGKRKQVLRQ